MRYKKYMYTPSDTAWGGVTSTAFNFKNLNEHCFLVSPCFEIRLYIYIYIYSSYLNNLLLFDFCPVTRMGYGVHSSHTVIALIQYVYPSCTFV